MLRLYSSSLIVALLMCWQVAPVEARGFRVAFLPNGSENGCANCHFRAGGGGARNSFGEDVFGLVGSSRQQFWTPEFAAEDSDEDGFTNGVELGDVDGDGVPERTDNISAPGDPASGPVFAPGDCNFDMVLNADDLSCVESIEARDAVLTALNTLPGDLDGNGDVGFADFLVLSANFGQELPLYTDGNIDLQGPIDFTDFLIISDNFGQTAAEALSPVPEPHSGLLGVAGVLPLLWSRKLRSRRARRESGR